MAKNRNSLDWLIRKITKNKINNSSYINIIIFKIILNI